jgi:hypothetical protein
MIMILQHNSSHDIQISSSFFQYTYSEPFSTSRRIFGLHKLLIVNISFLTLVFMTELFNQHVKVIRSGFRIEINSARRNIRMETGNAVLLFISTPSVLSCS